MDFRDTELSHSYPTFPPALALFALSLTEPTTMASASWLNSSAVPAAPGGERRANEEDTASFVTHDNVGLPHVRKRRGAHPRTDPVAYFLHLQDR